MKKKCLTATAKQGIFIQNQTHPDIYDLMPESGANLPFKYFRLTKPYSPYLMRQGALYVAESFNNQKKVLHTGLKPTHQNNIFTGDLFNPGNNTKCLIIFRCNPENKQFWVYLLDGYYPRKIKSIINEISVS